MGDILSFDEADRILRKVEEWLTCFPPAYRVTDPDLQWDENYPYVKLQRCQLHVVGYMMMLAPLKYYLTRGPNAKFMKYDGTEGNFRAEAVSISPKLMAASCRLFDAYFPPTPTSISHPSSYLIRHLSYALLLFGIPLAVFLNEWK
jgi:hypothetical protein